MTDSISAVIAALIALAFGLATFERYLEKRRPHELSWSIALFMFSLASGALAVGASAGWTSVTYRLFFLFGGVMNVPFLAAGTVYLLSKRWLANAFVISVSLFGAFSAAIIFSEPFHAALPRHVLAQASKVLPGIPVILAGVGSGLGSLILVGGAIYSAIRIRRGRPVVANCLIAIGTLVTGASGLLNSVFDKMTAFSVSLSVGIAIIFAGFLVASDAPMPSRETSGRPIGSSSPRVGESA